MDPEDFQFWGPVEVKTAKAPKKVVSITHYKQLLQLDKNEKIVIFESWFYPNDESDSKVLQALLQLKHVKQVSIYGRKSDLVTRKQLEFPPLTKLRFGECQIPEVFPFMYTNSSVTQLNLNSNNIKVLPEELSGMKNLKEIFLFENKIEEFPMVLLKLTQLQKIDINFCQLKSVPQEIGVLKNLNRIFVNHNPDLNYIPKKVFLTQLKALKAFSANGTKWSETESAKEFFRDMKRRGVLCV